ncbi:hypothetical protein SK128_007698 [Halocaridina rubra]|uniref:Uncharacterized protein n=1 Tax=Halocaridina rubra TaxID=373956 RepID=A0AAN8X6X8_HALRR
MSFSEVEALSCNVGSSVGISALSLNASSLGHSSSSLNHVKPSIGQNLPGLSHSTNINGQSMPIQPNFQVQSPSSLASGLSTPTVTTSIGLSDELDPALSSNVYTSHLTSPAVTFPPVSRPSLASMQGIGGFTSPSLSPPSPVTPNSIASTLGNPQMPSITCFNSRAPMGYHFRMAGCHLSGVPYVYKRKPEDEPEEVKPAAKQHISEERMAAHLNSLHLSETYCNHRLGKRGWSSQNKEAILGMDEDQGLGEDEQGISSPEISKETMRLVIADEVKQIVPGESQLPPQLLKKLRQPRMEVVLWQPPGDVIRNIITSSVNQQEGETSSSTEVEVIPSQSESVASSSHSQNGSNSSSPDSGVSVTSPPPLLFAGQEASAASSSSSDIMDDLLSLPSTSSGSRGGYLPPLRRPASPLPDPMADDDFSERMEFNNNNDNAPNFMWLEENNNSALIDLNAIEPHRVPHLEDLPDLPDSDDMDL